MSNDPIKDYVEFMSVRLGNPMTPSDFMSSHTDWINYCECIISGDGMIYDLHGSHSDALNLIAAKTLGQSLDQYMREMPHKYWYATDWHALNIVRGISVRYNEQESTVATRRALNSLRLLSESKFINYNLQVLHGGRE